MLAVVVTFLDPVIQNELLLMRECRHHDDYLRNATFMDAGPTVEMTEFYHCYNMHTIYWGAGPWKWFEGDYNNKRFRHPPNHCQIEAEVHVGNKHKPGRTENWEMFWMYAAKDDYKRLNQSSICMKMPVYDDFSKTIFTEQENYFCMVEKCRV